MKGAIDLKESLTERFSTFFTLSGSEVVYMLALTAVLVFFTSFEFVSVEAVPSSAMIIQHYGFPFEIFSKMTTLFNGKTIFHGQIENITLMKTTTQFSGIGLVLNPLIYATLSFVIVKAIGKVREEIEYRRIQ